MPYCWVLRSTAFRQLKMENLELCLTRKGCISARTGQLASLRLGLMEATIG
jgi:hypothetical protein